LNPRTSCPLDPERGLVPTRVAEETRVATVERLTSQQREDFQERFQRLAREWKEKSRYLSNTAQMAMLRPYQQIIAIGPPAAPLILKELQREPDHWFWALECIAGENPVTPEIAGRVHSMAQASLDWGEERGLIAA